MPLEGWLVDKVQQAPQLSCIVSLKMKTIHDRHCKALHPETDVGLRIVTFTNGIDMLFHAQQEVCYFHEWAVEGFAEWVEGKHQLNDTVESLDQMWVYLTQGNVSTLALAPSSPGVEDNPGSDTVNNVFEDGCCDMTSFRGSPLPSSLLDRIYLEIGRSKRWRQGARGLTLPADVWELLHNWSSATAIAE